MQVQIIELLFSYILTFESFTDRSTRCNYRYTLVLISILCSFECTDDVWKLNRKMSDMRTNIFTKETNQISS